MKNMVEYQSFYLKCDVLLLSEVFEKFRIAFSGYFRLDPGHYFSSSGLSWDAMLKTADFESEYILDVDMYQFIEKEVRGGVSYIAQRYNKFKNKRIE